MKMWRKLAMVEGKGTGRKIKHMYQMQEALFKQQPKVYPLLARILVHSGIATVARPQPAETVNETV